MATVVFFPIERTFADRGGMLTKPGEVVVIPTAAARRWYGRFSKILAVDQRRASRLRPRRRIDDQEPS